MITLLTGNSLKFKLNAAHTTNALNAMMSGRKFTASTVTPVNNIIDSNGATDVVLLDGIASGEQAEVNSISIFNSDTVNQVVTVEINNGSSDFVLFKCTLAPGERMEFNDGFRVFATTGAVKQSINQGANATSTGWTTVVLGSDVTNNNATANTIADVTGLSAPMTSGKVYYFKFVIWYTSAATSTGSRWSVNASAGTAANLSMTSEYSLTTTTTTRNANVQGFDLPAASNATSASTANNMCVMEGYFIPTANCTFIARFASEISGSAITAKTGSVLYYQQLT